MLNRIISIVAGILLMLGVGITVYLNKPAPYVPVDISTTQVTQPTQAQNSSNINTTLQRNNENDDNERAYVTPTPAPTTPSPIQSTPPTSGGITMAQIAQHGSRSSCWSVINGSVYDLTSWIPNHPGGEQTILSLCGINGSSGYNAQHGGSNNIVRILGGFKIGVFKN
jgi:cytochrome b involved in lipid metabolism